MSFIKHCCVREMKGILYIFCIYDSNYYSQDEALRLGVKLPDKIINSSKKRQAEFAVGRFLAHKEINKKGIYVDDIAIGENRCPLWPKGIIGSISHSDNYAVCCVLYNKECAGIGIDIEEIKNSFVCLEVLNIIATVKEINILKNLGFSSDRSAVICFSAKESAFKAIYPFLKIYIDFSDSELTVLENKKIGVLVKKNKKKGILKDYFVGVNYKLFDDYVVTMAEYQG